VVRPNAAEARGKIGICGFFRADQLATGAYAYVENMSRGFADYCRASGENNNLDVAVFHGATNLRWTSEQLRYRQLPDARSRFAAETLVGVRDSADFDAVLFPNSFTPPIVRSRRVVTVIHDLQYLKMPEYWPLAKRAWMRMNHEITLRKCDAVVAISQTVKDDILNSYGHRWESRVHAILNPVSLDRYDQMAEPTLSIGRPYILCTAVDRPPKNLSTLIRAFAILRKRFPDYCLVLVGQLRTEDRTWRRRAADVESKAPSAADLVRQLDLSEHVKITGFVPDAQLGALYRDAAVFVLPSLFEGFGMPAVESLALGAPTLVTDLPVLREVTQNAAFYIADPLDERQLADDIAQVISLGDSARPPSDFCSKYRQLFKPETVARKYVELMLDGDS
jgi:glycosyltransferase involved in cell wall biosynthesis